MAMMLPGAFSAPLLEADLLGTAAAPAGAPAFLGREEAAGAACDPAIFLVDDPEPANPADAAGSAALFPSSSGAPALAQTAALDMTRRPQASSAGDMLRELESSMDFLLPTQSIESLLLGGSDGGSDGWHTSPPASGPSTPPSTWQAAAAFPAIPEEAELPQAQLAPALPGMLTLAIAISPSTFSHLPPAPPPPLSLFVPVPSHAPGLTAVAPDRVLSASPGTAADASGSSDSEATSPTASSTSSLQGLRVGFSGGTYPRIASMPNLHLNLEEISSAVPWPAQRRRTSGRSRAMLRSRSHSDLGAGGAGSAGAAGGGELERYNVPHLPFLTPPHLRKGRGGRQPAIDPRLDPSIDPKRARRIMANRLSAAKSKMKQKNSAQVEAQKAEVLRLQREGLLPEPEPMEASLAPEERSRASRPSRR